MALIDLLLKWRDTSGVGRLVIQAQMRDYCNRANTVDLLDEIGAIFDDDFLDVLIGVGMKGVLYYKVIAQKAQILGI